MRITGILETALYVNDMSRTVDFYRSVFGFEPLLESDRLTALNVADRNVLLLFLSGATLEPFPTAGGVIPAHDGSGRVHFAFGIATDDVEPWHEHLIASGVPVESTVEWPGGAISIYFRDPDDHLVELITPGFWQFSTTENP